MELNKKISVLLSDWSQTLIDRQKEIIKAENKLRIAKKNRSHRIEKLRRLFSKLQEL